MIRKQTGNNHIIRLLEGSLVEYNSYWVNVCNGFNTGHTPPVNQAQEVTRHPQARWPCCCSSFHHFHSPMSPLFLRNHAGVGHSIKAATFGCFLPFRVSEWNNNDEIWKAFMTTTKLSFFFFFQFEPKTNRRPQPAEHSGIDNWLSASEVRGTKTTQKTFRM